MSVVGDKPPFWVLVWFVVDKKDMVGVVTVVRIVVVSESVFLCEGNCVEGLFVSGSGCGRHRDSVR